MKVRFEVTMMHKPTKGKSKDEIIMIERIGDKVRTLYASGRVRVRKKKQFLLGV